MVLHRKLIVTFKIIYCTLIKLLCDNALVQLLFITYSIIPGLPCTFYSQNINYAHSAKSTWTHWKYTHLEKDHPQNQLGLPSETLVHTYIAVRQQFSGSRCFLYSITHNATFEVTTEDLHQFAPLATFAIGS